MFWAKLNNSSASSPEKAKSGSRTGRRTGFPYFAPSAGWREQETPPPSSSLIQPGCFHFNQTIGLLILRKLLSLHKDNASYNTKSVELKTTNNHSDKQS